MDHLQAVKDFRDFCAGYHPDTVIDHSDLDDCAMGQYAKSLEVDSLTVADRLRLPLQEVCGAKFFKDLSSIVYGPIEFPTYGVMTEKLTTAIDAYA